MSEMVGECKQIDKAFDLSRPIGCIHTPSQHYTCVQRHGHTATDLPRLDEVDGPPQVLDFRLEVVDGGDVQLLDAVPVQLIIGSVADGCAGIGGASKAPLPTIEPTPTITHPFPPNQAHPSTFLHAPPPKLNSSDSRTARRA